MSIEEKYGIYYFNKKRYYRYDLSTDAIVLQDTIPYLFEYDGNKIYDSAWNRMTVKILELLDSINPISESVLLSLEYPWSKTQVFSKEKRTNFLGFKNIYVNTNHTATHAGMNIKMLLETYGVDPSDCTLYIRRHHAAEPAEAREYYRNQNITAFRSFLSSKGKSQEFIDVAVGNFNTINKFLAHGNTGFNDFFLFDDYGYFLGYKAKTIDFVRSRYYGTKYQSATEKGLELLTAFFKQRDFYLNINNVNIPEDFKDILISEIEFLFRKLNTNIISASKLYARMTMLHEDEMESLNGFNNESDFYSLVEFLLSKDYTFKKPFIANDPNVSLSNDDIIMNYVFTLDRFDLDEVKNYVSKMHLKRPKSYAEFMESCSEYYVQISSEEMVSKECFNIESNELDKILKELKFYLKSFGPIDTSVYADYTCFPSLDYQWNKYLLVGIIRSFFSEELYVESTGGSINNCEFIISLV